MATVVDTRTETDLVADAAARIDAARGNQVLEIPLLEMVHVALAADVATVRSVVAVEERTVELVVDDRPFEALGPAVWALSARGWNVAVRVPCGRAGEAHRALRGTPCLLQSWWRQDERVCFGAFEIP